MPRRKPTTTLARVARNTVSAALSMEGSATAFGEPAPPASLLYRLTAARSMTAPMNVPIARPIANPAIPPNIICLLLWLARNQSSSPQTSKRLAPRANSHRRVGPSPFSSIASSSRPRRNRFVAWFPLHFVPPSLHHCLLLFCFLLSVFCLAPFYQLPTPPSKIPAPIHWDRLSRHPGSPEPAETSRSSQSSSPDKSPSDVEPFAPGGLRRVLWWFLRPSHAMGHCS